MSSLRKSSTKKTWLKWLLLVLILAAIAFSVLRGGLLRKSSPVKVIAVAKGNINSFITVSGNLISDDEISLSSPVTGRISTLDAKVGSRYRAGQNVLQFDTREVLVHIKERQIALKSAQASQQAAKLEWDTLKQLYEIGGESKKSVVDAQLKWLSAQAGAQAIETEIQRLRLEVERYTLKAPIDAVVTTVSARSGVWVNAGETLLKLSGTARQEIEVKVDSGDSNAVSVGKLVTLSSEVFPGQEWEEKISWIAPSTKKEGSTNALAVRVPLSARAPGLLLGQQVDVKINIAKVNDVVVVPVVTVSSRQGKSYVAVVDNGLLHYVPVTLGLSGLKMIEVKGGLQVGQMIVLPGGKPLAEGDRVVVEAEGLKAL